jgi:hypothetical protein
LIRELIDHLLQIIDRNLGLIKENMVVNRASSALDGSVGIEIEVILKGMSDVGFNQSARQGVSIAIRRLAVSILGEEADVMTLGADNDSPFDLFWDQQISNSKRIYTHATSHLWTILFAKSILHITQLVVENVSELTLRDTITEVVDMLRATATANVRNPLLKERQHHATNIVRGNHFDTVAIGLNSSRISASILIK